MSGVAIIRSLLASDAALTAQVPATRIFSGDVSQSSAMPAISVKQISSVPRWTVAMTHEQQHLDRVQVTVLVKATDASPAGSGYPSLRSILALVLAACPNQRGTVNGFFCDSILPEPEGPDFQDEEVGLHIGSRDFLVRWSAQA